MKHQNDPRRHDSRRPGPAMDDPLGEEFGDLSAKLDALPASREPEDDLWPGVAARLQPRSRSRFRRRRDRHQSQSPSFAPMWRQALAAGLGLVAGAVLTWLAMGGASATFMAPDGALLSADLRTTDLSSAEQAAAVRLASAATGLTDAESQFLRAKEELWLVVFARRDQLSPDAWRMVEQNLQILDGAVGDLRAALSEDPGNPDLERRILRNQRRSLDLLRDVADGLSSSV